MSNEVDQVRQAANRVNTSLMDYIMSLSDEQSKTKSSAEGSSTLPSTPGAARENSAPERRDSTITTRQAKPVAQEQSTDATSAGKEPVSPTATKSPQSLRETAELDYEEAVGALTLQFLNRNEATRVAALAWLIMLHKKSPRKV